MNSRVMRRRPCYDPLFAMTTSPTSEQSPPAPSDDALTADQYKVALAHAARDIFWPVSLGLGVIYTLTAISHGLRLDPDVRLPLTLLAAITGILLLTLGLHFRRHPLPTRLAHGMVGMLTLFAFANEVLQQQLTPDPFHQIFTSLFLLGTGVLVLSRRWLALGLVLGFVSWAAAYARSDDVIMVEWLYAHGAATATGCAAHVARRRTIHRIESLHQADIRHAARLQTALSELRESEAQFRQFVDKSEQTNRANQQRLSDLIADIDGIVWECDPHTMAFTFVSPRVESILGHSIQSWLLKPLRLFDIVHPDDRERIEQFCIERVARGLDHEMNHRVLAADGRVVWMNAKSRVIKDAAGRPVRVRGILLDVSESMRTAQALRDSQAILDRAQEIAQLGSWTWEQARGRVVWSPQMYRIHGITPEQFDGTWMKAYEMIHPDDQSRIWRLCERAIDTGEVESFEYRLIRGDGSVAIVRADGELQLDEQGRLERIIGTVQDVTELRSAEAERARLEDELRQVQKLDAVGTLASGVAHDFNNLLTAIHGYADLARQTLAADDAARQSLDMIEVAADQAAGVTQGLLTFAHRTPYEKTTIDLVPNIRQSLQLLRRLLPASIELVEDLPQGEVWIHADAHQLQQVWMNLTVNARDAMPNGGRLVIQLRRQPQGPVSPHDSWHGHTHDTHDTAAITVTDTGTGMTEQTIARIYEPYFTTKARGQGTGLGLSIVHGIISDHAGRIQVQSEVGKGTRFSLQLPCTDPPQPATAAGDKQTNIGHGEMILLAEDNEFVRAIMVASLVAAGYNVITAGDGHQAMAAYREHRDQLRLIILDLDLPKQSGDQCLTAIRAAGDQVPIIVITGNVDTTRQSAIEQNELTLLKPFQVARMTEMINHVLRESASQDETAPAEPINPFKDLN